MRRKQSRPLLILKPENEDFPFDIKDVNINEIKLIDYFRMYNSLKMVLEKIIDEQPLQKKLQANIDIAFKVFLQKDQTSSQQQKAGKRNQQQSFQKQEVLSLVESLTQMGFSDKQIKERLQLNSGVNGINQHSDIQEGDQQSGKKQIKEKVKQEQIIDKQNLQLQDQQFHTDDESDKK